MAYASMLFTFPFQHLNKFLKKSAEKSCLMLVLSSNNISVQVYRHYRIITESHRFISFGEQVEFKNSEEGKKGV